MITMNKRHFIEESEGEEYLHRDTWSVVNRQIDHAEGKNEGALYDDLVAMVFALYSLEGYLNFLGDKVAPDLWGREKEVFSQTGISGKLSKLCEICGISDFDEGRSTVILLKNLRDRIVHPKIQKTKPPPVKFSDGRNPPLFPKSYLAKLVSHPKALRARNDIKDVVDRLHSAAILRFPHEGLGQDGLEGIFSSRSSSIRSEL
jgi:hypothetical protein